MKEAVVSDDIKEGRVPFFLVTTWQRLNMERFHYISLSGTSCPLKDEKYEDIRTTAILVLVVLSLVHGVGVIVYMIGIFRGTKVSADVVMPLQMFGLFAILLLILFHAHCPLRLNGDKFSKWIIELFTEFDLTPSKELGAMSEEEFKTLIHSRLKKAADVDAMCKVAAVCDLCPRDYAHHLPQQTD